MIVREVERSDFPWLKRLAVQSSVYGIPHNRSIPNSAVQARARQRLEELERKVPPDFRILVAEDDGRRLGYLMLDLADVSSSTGERQSLIHDLAVEPDYWGKRVVHLLVNRAAQITAEHGLDYMVGEVSADNRRTVVQAGRLGFCVERLQIAMRCTAEGSGPMPGRPDAEKAHDQSRRRRRKKARVQRTKEPPQ